MIQALHAAHRGIIHRDHTHRVDERDGHRSVFFQPVVNRGDRAYRCHHHDDEACRDDPSGQTGVQVVDETVIVFGIIKIV